MDILFVHRFFPGQYAHLAGALAADHRNRVVFVHAEGEGEIPGVRRVPAGTVRKLSAATHHYLQPLERQVLLGQAVYRACRRLAGEGFRPDVVATHAGFGPGIYVKEAFPEPPLIGYFEWFYRARGSDADFLDPADVSEDDRLRIPTRNATLLLELAHCDLALCPTAFQKAQFPAAFRDCLTVLHDGVDTRLFHPRGVTDRGLPADLGVPDDAEVITFVSRGLEPYRGFPAFIETLSLLLPARPRLHAVVVGADRVFYGKPAPAGEPYGALVRRRFPTLAWDRVHLTGHVPYDTCRRILFGSHVHVYLTVPFVLSWSLLEAMAAGCAIVGSDTAPVREVVTDRATGRLADMRSPADLAATIATLLDDRSTARRLGERATRFVEHRYALDKLLPDTSTWCAP